MATRKEDISAFSEEFQEAVKTTDTFTSKPEPNELLKMYGLYKQVVVGNCETDEPSFYQMEAKAKWKAWKANEGKTNQEAQEEYVKFVMGTLKPKYT